MKLSTQFVLVALTFTNIFAQVCDKVVNGCITFTVGQGTGCDWMCNYCAQNVGPSYYFTTPVCAYQTGGCVGSPISGVQYTCCST